MLNCVIVGLGGFIGTVLRYLIGVIPVKETTTFPIKTFIINIVGAFVIGLIATFAAKNSDINPRLILFLKVGLCGGFTTFSTFALETSDLISKGNVITAFMYVILSVIIGILMVFTTGLIIK